MKTLATVRFRLAVAVIAAVAAFAALVAAPSVGGAPARAIAAAPPAQGARAGDCNRATPEAIVHIATPGSPFQPQPTRDGCWIFVSSASNVSANNGVAVIARRGGRLTLERVAAFAGSPAGMALTHDGRLLVVAAGDRTVFLDVDRLTSGRGDPVLGSMSDPRALGRVYINVSADDSLLFVSEERSQAISVIRLAEARRHGFDASSVVGQIPVGRSPIALTFSTDGKRLYTTSQSAPVAANWPNVCRPEGSEASTPPNHPQGAIMIVDVAKARTDPAHAVTATVAAGCNPVRLVLSPRGDVAYVTARGDHAVQAFDTVKLIADPAHALLGKVTAGTAPVGIAVIDNGRNVVATSSNRFGNDPADSQFLTVIDATRIARGGDAVIGTIPAGSFPRELRTTADGKTLLLTNFGSKTLEVIDLARLRPEPPIK